MKKLCEIHDTYVILTLSKIYDYLKHVGSPSQDK